MAKEKVIFFCAHPDDETFGAGGTIAKYVKEKKNLRIVTFSYGEMSHAWLQKRVTREMRKKELLKAQKILGYKHHINFGVLEDKFMEDANKKQVREKISKMIKQFKPDKIFTHAPEDRDPMGNHLDVHKLVMGAIHDVDYKGDVYGFGVWNPFSFKVKDYPRLYVDITDTFKIKLEALRCFESQWSSMIPLLWTVYVRAISDGLTNNVRFAERFYKIG